MRAGGGVRTSEQLVDLISSDEPYWRVFLSVSGLPVSRPHGIHVAGIIAGDSPSPQDSLHQTAFRGVALGANLISLRVIGANGTGSTSSVIAAIHWAIKNRHRYNIRVINLSLGHVVEESYKDDPLCETVERAVQAGIVVVVAAGNRGKDDAGYSIYGGIESPGNDPYVITVGALNTHNTVARSDDELATYSSKGPTVMDGLIKPDISAPGNRIVSAKGDKGGDKPSGRARPLSRLAAHPRPHRLDTRRATVLSAGTACDRNGLRRSAQAQDVQRAFATSLVTGKPGTAAVPGRSVSAES